MLCSEVPSRRGDRRCTKMTFSRKAAHSIEFCAFGWLLSANSPQEALRTWAYSGLRLSTASRQSARRPEQAQILRFGHLASRSVTQIPTCSASVKDSPCSGMRACLTQSSKARKGEFGQFYVVFISWILLILSKRLSSSLEQ